MNVEQLLTQRKLETLKVSGYVENVIDADTMSWSALSAVLGGDVITAWRMTSIAHEYKPADDDGPEGVVFTAEFVRTPDEEVES